MERGANLAATTQPKETKSRMRANIEFKEGDSVQAPWDKAAAQKGAKMAHDATVVEIDWAKGHSQCWWSLVAGRLFGWPHHV